MAIPKGPIGSERAVQVLTQLESKLEQMRRKFNMYFNGFERTPPTAEFEVLKREFRELTQMSFSTGQSRFKAQNLVARWQLQRSIWERDLQRREEGNFKPGAGRAAMQRSKPADLDE